MINKIQSVRGMYDCLPNQSILLQKLENFFYKILISYGYQEIRLPIVEHTSLFTRSIGHYTDIVEKEMYSFVDINGDYLTLRPEGTTGCVRAGIEHGLFYNNYNKIQRLWYIGPMFRHERPQKGRYRQFNQLGVEIFGHKEPFLDAELIQLTYRWWKKLKIEQFLTLEINSIGDIDTRIRYRNDLISFLVKNISNLDENYKKIIYKNPMRFLDSKNSNIKTLLKHAPRISDYLDNESKNHFYRLCKYLNLVNIKYKINPYLVRGLDYYNKTVFEWLTPTLGSQNTICAGGRYDNLVKILGGNDTPAVGCALGLERLVLLINTINYPVMNNKNIDIYLIVSKDDSSKEEAMVLSELIRDKFPSLCLVTDYSGNVIKKQFSRANKYGAKIALVLGINEIITKTIILKELFSGKQKKIYKNEIITQLKHSLLSQ